MRGKKKIAIITGATSGFGKIFAEDLKQYRAKIS